MSRWIKGSEAKKAYNIPDRVYRQACNGLGACGFKPSGEHGHWFFEVDKLIEFLNKKQRGEI